MFIDFLYREGNLLSHATGVFPERKSHTHASYVRVLCVYTVYNTCTAVLFFAKSSLLTWLLTFLDGASKKS